MNAILLAVAIFACPDPPAAQTVIVVIGAAGEEQYGQLFHQWANRWQEAASRGGADFEWIGSDARQGPDDRDLLKKKLDDEPRTGDKPLWLVLIGHGTFDGQTAKFNLRGPDLAANELAQWLSGFQRPLAVINCASSSGPFINQLTGDNRVIVTATKSGVELNFARFGDYLSAAISDPAADLDKDVQTSLLEAFIAASKQTSEYYQANARLATEHAILDDNGDGLGTPADWFRGVRAVRRAKDDAPLDGLRANQFCLVRSPGEKEMPADTRVRRDELERSIADLREHKNELAEDQYYTQLEVLLLELAELYESLEDKT